MHRLPAQNPPGDEVPPALLEALRSAEVKSFETNRCKIEAPVPVLEGVALCKNALSDGAAVGAACFVHVIKHRLVGTADCL